MKKYSSTVEVELELGSYWFQTKKVVRWRQTMLILIDNDTIANALNSQHQIFKFETMNIQKDWLFKNVLGSFVLETGVQPKGDVIRLLDYTDTTSNSNHKEKTKICSNHPTDRSPS